MSLADDINNALTLGARAGATAASKAGRNLLADINNFVVPHLRDIAIHVASIIEKRRSKIYTDATAKGLIAAQEGAIQTLVDTMVALAVLEAQTIFNAIIDALNKAVNTALGFILLA